MQLIELPNGDFIATSTVLGVRAMVNDKMGPRVLLDVSTAGGMVMIEFDDPEAARIWAREFSSKVNSACHA